MRREDPTQHVFRSYPGIRHQHVAEQSYHLQDSVCQWAVGILNILDRFVGGPSSNVERRLRQWVWMWVFREVASGS
jgi:hypothetical protein